MIEYLQSLGQWLDENPQEGMADLLAGINPVGVEIDFLHFLGELIGLTISRQSGLSDDELRRQVTEAVDWYRVKGTYASANTVLYTLGFSARIYDLWTSDYLTFVRVPFFTGYMADPYSLYGLYMDSGLFMDTGIDLDYFFKSPHFDVEIDLISFVLSGGIEYLLSADRLTEAIEALENVRPVNTVPHYFFELAALTDESQTPYTITQTHVATTVTTSWNRNVPILDDGRMLDDNLFMDLESESFLSGITKFKIGTGNYGVTPDASMTDLADPTYTGDVIGYEVLADRVRFTFEVPEGTTADISEFGLFDEAGTTMFAIGTCPIIHKTTDYMLQCSIDIMLGDVL